MDIDTDIVTDTDKNESNLIPEDWEKFIVTAKNDNYKNKKVNCSSGKNTTKSLIMEKEIVKFNFPPLLPLISPTQITNQKNPSSFQIVVTVILKQIRLNC